MCTCQSDEMALSGYVPDLRNHAVHCWRLPRYERRRWSLLQPQAVADIVAAAIVGKFMRLHRAVDCGISDRVGFVALAILMALTLPGFAKAEGAMAVGIARGGVAKGYATGFAINQPSVKAARNNAVEQCRRMKNSNADARSGCEVVVTFRNKCVASAIDPGTGTPGAGWGIGGSQKMADSQALGRCRAKAGAERAEFCEVTDRFCDGEGK